jgi:hypothetical protein
MEDHLGPEARSCELAAEPAGMEYGVGRGGYDRNGLPVFDR